MAFVPTTPQQGALYHRLNTLIAANYSGLGPNNIGSNPYTPMVGFAFQKPMSGSTTATSVAAGPHPYR